MTTPDVARLARAVEMLKCRSIGESWDKDNADDLAVVLAALRQLAAEKPLAHRLFDGREVEHEIDEALVVIFGAKLVDGESDPDTWPCTNLCYDGYDSSFELWGCKDDFVPTPEQIAAAFALGFARCWFVYGDGTTERYADRERPLTERHVSSYQRENSTKLLLAKAAHKLAAAEARAAQAEAKALDVWNRWRESLTEGAFSHSDGVKFTRMLAEGFAGLPEDRQGFAGLPEKHQPS